MAPDEAGAALRPADRLVKDVGDLATGRNTAQEPPDLGGQHEVGSRKTGDAGADPGFGQAGPVLRCGVQQPDAEPVRRPDDRLRFRVFDEPHHVAERDRAHPQARGEQVG